MSLGSKCSFSRFFSVFLIVDSPPHKICHSKPDDETGSREKSSNDPEVLWLRKRRGAQRWVAHWLWGTDSQLRGFRFLRLAFLGGGLGYLFVVSPNLVSFVWGRNNFWYLKTISWYMVDATIFHIYVYTSFSCTTYSLRKCFFVSPTSQQNPRMTFGLHRAMRPQMSGADRGVVVSQCVAKGWRCTPPKIN